MLSGGFGANDLDGTVLDTEGVMDDCDDGNDVVSGSTLDIDAGVDDLDDSNGGAVDYGGSSAGGTVDDSSAGGAQDSTGGDGTTGDTVDDSSAGDAQDSTGGDGTTGGDSSATIDDATGADGDETETGTNGDEIGTDTNQDANDGSGKGKDPHATEVEGDWTDGGTNETITYEDDEDDGDTGDSSGGYGSTVDGSSGGPTEDTTEGVLFGGEGTDNLGLDPTTVSDPTTIRLAQCAVNDPNTETIMDDNELLEETISYDYVVSIDGSVDLDTILSWVELKVLTALGTSNEVMACSNARRLERGSGRHLNDGLSALRIETKPAEYEGKLFWYLNMMRRLLSGHIPHAVSLSIPTAGNCFGECDVAVTGKVTVSVPEPTAGQLKLQCEILPFVYDALESDEMGDIEGLEELRVEEWHDDIAELCAADPTGTAAGAQTTASESSSISAGVAVGAAVGGMCLVLLGLLVVRQRMIKKREGTSGGTVLTKETKPIDHSAMEMTVDANETQTTHQYLTPKATQSDDSSTVVLGISASPDDCSEWGDNKRISKIENDEDVESPAFSKTDPEPSDITFGDELTPVGSSRNAAYVSPPDKGSPDPPSDEDSAAPAFQPNVREEESLMHVVDIMDDDDTLRDGLAEA